MKKLVFSIVLPILCLSSINLNANDTYVTQRRANAATTSSFNATAISMAFWGLLIAGGITAILLTVNTSHS
ncbi:MAG: hypothetical protein A3F40_02665 [Chlamydiae bacterium RIFCSPHIGHO2_12_FULL_27_8]|nr:MAG: hypothetical protein A3F40_02665 [Chlamydiae bacterium RIFCSPHIGHO2_12_FULL_27_8]OGN66299.1 MAG: hypothetical protein A2888_00435 [Chlamydiae bacterium RIFCSPLOWO2_01_FULL_28_7]